MKYFIDCEFIEGFHKPLFGKRRHFIDLISIGIIREDGRQFYAISTDFNPRDANPWVREHVLPKLSKNHQYYKSNKAIASRIADFFGCYYDGSILRTTRNHTEIYGYYCDYDWVLFCSLFGTMMKLPVGFPMYCIDLKQMMHERGLTDQWKLQNCPDPPQEHNALVDAAWNMQLYKAIIKSKQSV